MAKWEERRLQSAMTGLDQLFTSLWCPRLRSESVLPHSSFYKCPSSDETFMSTIQRLKTKHLNSIFMAPQDTTVQASLPWLPWLIISASSPHVLFPSMLFISGSQIPMGISIIQRTCLKHRWLTCSAWALFKPWLQAIVVVQLPSHVRLSATPWTSACQPSNKDC